MYYGTDAAAEETDVGPRPNAIAVTRRLGLEGQREKLAAAVREADDGGGVLLLTDAEAGLGGHLAQAVAAAGRIAIVSGMNLPMLTAVLEARSHMALGELAALARDTGRRCILLTE